MAKRQHQQVRGISEEVSQDSVGLGSPRFNINPIAFSICICDVAKLRFNVV